MSDCLTFEYQVPGDDFTRAGEASSSVKNKLKLMGVDSGAIRRVAIAMYEGEINMVIHAGGGAIKVMVTDDNIRLILADTRAERSRSPSLTRAWASPMWKRPCSLATPPPRRRFGPWALAQAWGFPT